MKKTPLQQLIDKLTEYKSDALELAKDSRANKVPTETPDAYCVAYSVAIAYAKSLLSAEKEEILNAHIFAHCEHGGGKIFQSELEQQEAAEEYFNNAYEQ